MTTETYRVNHIPSPFFTAQPLKFQSKTANCTYQFVSGTGYNIQSADGEEYQLNFLLPEIAPGEYVLSFDVAVQDGLKLRFMVANHSITESLYGGTVPGTNATVPVKATFDNPTTQSPALQFRCNGDVVVRTGMQLELASTYDAAVAGGGLRFFAWNTMPRE